MAGAKLTKEEEIERMVAAAVNAGEERHLETVDFNTTFLNFLMRRSGGHTPVGGFGDLRSGTEFGSFS